ncbi:MAG: DUF87 domain-containing protein [Tenuifilaceae bacterium]|jgi:DNA phosphorothioation-dependent restriction protein DptH|nr:DUF87 domain-containing protein [Tenuifilaceae bacterium]
MRYFTNTVLSHIDGKIARHQGAAAGQRMIIMIPEMPAKNLLSIADAVDSYCKAGTDIALTLKIAKILTDSWEPAERQKAQSQQWLDDRGNLTYYRNIAPKDAKLSLVVLCGADRVTDSASLADFHTCTPDIIWRQDMSQSFSGWMEQKLQGLGIHVFRAADLQSFDRILKPLIDYGRGDLLRISDWLERIDLSHAGDVFEVQKTILTQLHYFGLPSFARFPLQNKTKSFGPYLDRAGAFFSYTLFLEASARSKATKAINNLLEALENGEDPGFPLEDDDVLGPYQSGEELLLGLRKYVESDNPGERAKLIQCDFVTILDKILKYRKPREPRPPGIRKISGNPVEMLLTTIWRSLSEFSRERNIDPDAQITEIAIRGDIFKHDMDEEEESEGDNYLDKNEKAAAYLACLVGGLDQLAERIDLTNKHGDEIVVTFFLAHDKIRYQYTKTAEPHLTFTVEVKADTEAKPLQRKFAWRLPEHHPYRLSQSLLLKAKVALDAHQAISKLPVFHLPYYDELLRTSSDEEIRRVLLHCVRDEREDDKFLTNILSDDWLDVGDGAFDQLKALAAKYHRFVRLAFDRGVIAALLTGQGRTTEWSELANAYKDSCKAATADENAIMSPSAGMLLRAFLVIAQRDGSSTEWYADQYEQSGIATVLHPVLLEMLEAQIIYMFQCFNYAARKEISRENRRDSFKEHIWRAYVDLASIQAPLAGLLCNEDKNLDTNIRGQGLIHLLGTSPQQDGTLSTRLLSNYDIISDDDEVSDTEMFRATSESQLLLRLIRDYFHLHPHARDGLSLAVFRNRDIQPVIAAIDQYLNLLADHKQPKTYILHRNRNRRYAFSVTIFTESSDDSDVAKWIEQWRERWEAAESEKKYAPYMFCRFAVAHRLVERGEREFFQRLLKENFEADIAVFYDFIGVGESNNRFERVPPFNITDIDLKFPILEKACCTVDTPADKYRRSRITSNRQFTLGAAHTNLMHCLAKESPQSGTIVIGSGDFKPWQPVINELHNKTEWVVCIDPNIDERLVKQPLQQTTQEHQEREIIGFGSGVGNHGEDNYTVSTEQFTLADIHARLCAALGSHFAETGWTAEDCQEITRGVLQEARKLSGLSLVRATGVDDNHLRDFMAYALVRRMLLEEKDTILCDDFVSLDAYGHWFDLADNRSKPDLLWLRARIGEDQRLHLEMHLIECKVAKESQEHLRKARSQINNGLSVLKSAFVPIQSCSAEDRRPDQRYWWMQLHRLIASKAEIKRSRQAEVINALERLGEGDFEITWKAAVFAFWIDKIDDRLQRIGTWESSTGVQAAIFITGSTFIKNLAMEKQNFSFSWDGLHNKAVLAPGNVCDFMEDEKFASRPEDDHPAWGEDDTDEDDYGGGSSEETVQDDFGEIDAESTNSMTTPLDSSSSLAKSKQTTTTTQAVKEEKDSQQLYGYTGLDSVAAAEQPVPAGSLKPARILLGTTLPKGLPVYWEFGHPGLENRHLLIFGKSGMGKTYAIQCLLNEMSRSKQHSLIIDYTDGFLPNQLETVTNDVLRPVQHVIRQNPLPINPFIPQSSDHGGIAIKENANAVAKRIASIFEAVYGIGDQQFSVLHEVIMDGIGQYGARMSLDHMLSMIQERMQEKQQKSAAQTLFSKIRPFILDRPFGDGEAGLEWGDLLYDKKIYCHIFQLAGLDMYTRKLVTEFVLWDLYGYLQAKGEKSKPKVLVLDEVQNLDLREGSPLSKYLREGRKFGLSLIMATQIMSSMRKDERDKMFNAAQKLFFRPADTELKSFADIAAMLTRRKSDEWVQSLASLGKGECYSIGPAWNPTTDKLVTQAQRIKITSLEERGFDV